MTQPAAHPNPHARPDAALHQLFSAAIGPVNAEDYSRRFLDYEAHGTARWGWHWPAGLWTLNWLLFRRLYGWALGYAALALLVPVVILGGGKLLRDWSAETLVGVLAALVLAKIVIVALCAYPLYYSACRQRMADALAQHDSLAAACEQLRLQGSTRAHFLRLLGLNAALVALGVAGAAAFWLTRTPPERNTAPALPRAAAPRAPTASSTPTRTPASGIANTPAASAPTAAQAGTAPPALPSPAASALALTASAPASSASPQPSASAPAATRVSAQSPASPASAPRTPAQPGVNAPPARVVQAASTLRAPSPYPLSVASTEALMHVYVPRAQQVAASTASPASETQTHAPQNHQKSTVPPRRTAAASAAISSDGGQNAKGTIWVNAGLFAKAENAQQVQKTLAEANLPVTIQPLQRNGGVLHRVRVGPFATGAQAQRALVHIKALGLDGVIAKP
ncbi:MAG: hypothetical protein Fur007_14860 [Rhodoferax sp.]